MKLKMFGKPKPARPVDVINSALRTHVSVGRFRISREQADHIRELEKRDPNLALAQLLLYLRLK